MIKNLALVFVGGGLGSCLRYWIGTYLNKADAFPFGTLLVNISGSLLIGIILGMALKNQMLNANTTLLFAVGFCGGYTTFSSFAYESYTLLKNDQLWALATYTIGSFGAGILAVFVGLWLSRLV